MTTQHINDISLNSNNNIVLSLSDLSTYTIDTSFESITITTDNSYITMTTLVDPEDFNHIFYFKETNQGDLSFCVDYTNLPYFQYSNNYVTEANAIDPSYTQIKYDVLAFVIKSIFSSTRFSSLVKNKQQIINSITTMDLSLNQTMISKIKTAGGTMDNPKSKDDDSISKFILNCLLTIFSNNNERKTEFENYLKGYFNRINAHIDEWIPIAFSKGDKISRHLKYNLPYLEDYSHINETNRKYRFVYDISDNIFSLSDSSSQFIDLSLSTPVDLYYDPSSEYYYYTFNGNNNTNSIKYKLNTNSSNSQTYLLTDICSNFPIAFLNHGKETKITYTGDDSKKVFDYVYGDDISYAFYYGDVSLNIYGNFDVLSFVSKQSQSSMDHYTRNKMFWYYV